MRAIHQLGSVFMFLGGLGLFMYGVQTTSEALQKFAANHLTQILRSLTKRESYAVLSGVIITVAFQSSAATTVLVVEFVNAGLMNLGQALGVVLGSALGTSITIQLIAFNFLDIALGAIFVGFTFFIFGKRRWKHLGHALLGFGLIFVGMAYMSNASAPLKDIRGIYPFLAHLGSEPLLGILVGSVVTAVLQSSTAFFAMMMSMASQNLLALPAVIPLVLGSHIGGTVTTLLSSFATESMDAKRTAVANTGYKVAATLLIFPFLQQFTGIVQASTADLLRQIANAHLFFALFMVVLFFPFNNGVARGLKCLIPDRPRPGTSFTFHFIDEASLEVPTVALRQAWEETHALAVFIEEQMLQKMGEILAQGQCVGGNDVKKAEEQVDWYYRHIMRFLSRLSQKGLTEELEDKSMNIQFILKELERIGDVFAGMVQHLEKLERENLNLNKTEWNLLIELFAKIAAYFHLMSEALPGWDTQRAGEIIRERPEVIRLQRSLQFETLAQAGSSVQGENINRDDEKLRYAVLDLLDLIYRIDDHVVNIAQVVLGII